MLARPCHPDRPDRPRQGAPKPVKLRPASHSYLARQCEPLVAATIASLSALLILTGVWLIRLLG